MKICTWPSCLSEEEQIALADAIEQDPLPPPLIDRRVVCSCTEPSPLAMTIAEAVNHPSNASVAHKLPHLRRAPEPECGCGHKEGSHARRSVTMGDRCMMCHCKKFEEKES